MRLTIKVKLAATFAVVVALSAVTMLIALQNLVNLNGSFNEAMDGGVARMLLANDIQSDVLQLAGNESRNILSTDPNEDKALVASMNEEVAGIKDKASKLSDESTAEGKTLVAGFMSAFDGYLTQHDQIIKLADANQNTQAYALSIGQAAQLHQQMDDALNKLIAREQSVLSQERTDNGRLFDGSRNLLIGLLIGSALLAAIAATWIVLGISRGLNRIKLVLDAVAIGDLEQKIVVTSNDEIKDLVDTANRMVASQKETAGVADRVASGDLTVEPKPLSEKDVLGLALKQMVERLREVISEASSSARNLASGSQELSATAEQLSQGATEQASST